MNPIYPIFAQHKNPKSRSTKDNEESQLCSHLFNVDASAIQLSIIGISDNQIEIELIEWQIKILKGMLTENSLEFFKHFLNISIQVEESIHKYPTICVGNADGSASKMILAAIQSGNMSLNYDGIVQLAQLLNIEAEHYKLYDTLPRYFQENEEARNAIAYIHNNSHYYDSSTKCIFLGNCLHDKYNCNKDAEMGIREKLWAKGVIFIGSDYTHKLLEYSSLKSRKEWEKESVGFYAYNSQNLLQLQAHFNKCFVKAYWHDNILYINRGISINEYHDDSVSYKTEFGNVRARNIMELVNKINMLVTSDSGFIPSKGSMGLVLSQLGLSGIRHSHKALHQKHNEEFISNLNSRTPRLNSSQISANIKPIIMKYI